MKTALSWRPVAVIAAVAGILIAAPVVVAAAFGDQGESLETTRTIVLGGDDPSFGAELDVPESWPDCGRGFSLSPGSHEYVCGDVTVTTRSARGVHDLAEFGRRAVRSHVLADASDMDMLPMGVPADPEVIGWVGGGLESWDGDVYSVVVLGREMGNKGPDGIVAIVNGDGDAVDDAVAAIGKRVTFGEER